VLLWIAAVIVAAVTGGGVEDVVTDTVFGLVRNALFAVATLALMVRFSWQMTLLTLAIIPLVGWPPKRATPPETHS
jgi:ABC-type bacteriocin/lantibiotic exporter with double-glycine peptidase domain